MSYCSEGMSITIGDFSESSGKYSESTPCRLCLKTNVDYYNIFTSVVSSQITVEDALYDLVDLKVAVGDGLPATLCALCLEKLIEFNDFRNVCHKSDAELRNVSFIKYSRSTGGERAVHDNLRSSTQTKDCAPDAIVSTSKEAYLVQPNEIFIPVPDIPLPTANMLFHIKDENEGHLSEENNPMLYTTDPAGSDASDPLATDDLSDPVKYECSSVKEDQINDDEEGHVLNDCSDGVSRKMMHQDSFHQSGIKTGSLSAKGDQSSNDEGRDAHNDSTDGTTNELVPQPSDQAQASTPSQGEEVDAERIGAIVVDLDSLLVLAKKESPEETDATESTSTENGELIQNQTMAMESMTEAVDLLAPERAAALLVLLEPKIRASNSRKVRKVMDKNIEKCGTPLADKISSCSIPDDGRFHSKSRHVSKIRGDKATLTVARETSGCDNPDIVKFFRITDSGKSSPKAGTRENKGISTTTSKNPGNCARSKNNSYHCFKCGDAFNAKHDLIEHLKTHFGSGSLDIDAYLTIGKDLSLKSPISRGETNSSYPTSSFKRLNKLICKRQGVRQKGNGLLKENFGGTRENKSVREARRSLIVDGKSCTDSPRRERKPYSCNECKESFSKKSCLVHHILTHTKEKPFSCGECEKSFSCKSHLVRHIHTHTKEKPYSCGECEKSFSRKSYLIDHIRTHTKEKPYFCGECETSFSNKRKLVRHIRTHAKEKPYSCSECEKSFPHKSDLVCHIRVHMKEKHSCSECEKSFSERCNLICHMRTHTKEKPYSCVECEKSFSHRSNLVRHMRTHTKEKPYSCDECEKSFSEKSNLICHMRIHTKAKPFPCGKCEKSFCNRGNLIRHFRIHTKEKPYSCGECEKSFAQRSNLVVHIRTHTKEKPYSCGECERSFSVRGSLVRHLQTHTEEKFYACNKSEKSYTAK